MKTFLVPAASGERQGQFISAVSVDAAVPHFLPASGWGEGCITGRTKLLDRELRTRQGAAARFKIGLRSVATFAGAKTMLWIVWALLLVSHGALSRWAQTADSYAKVSVFGDVILIAVALITLDQLQGLEFAEVLRVGIFFTAFGWAGRRLMGSVLKLSVT